MYKKVNANPGRIKCNNAIDGRTIESQIAEITQNKGEVPVETELIYTPKEDGVLPGYNIRTDRFEVAVEAVDKIEASRQARRDNAGKPQSKEEPKEEPKEDKTKGSKESKESTDSKE